MGIERIRLHHLILSCIFFTLGSAAIAEQPDLAPNGVPMLSGGDIARDVIDVTTMPLLALPQSINDENAYSLGVAETGDSNQSVIGLSRSNGGIGLTSTLGPMCATAPDYPYPSAGWTLTYAWNSPSCYPPYTTGYYQICFGPIGNRRCFNQVSYTSFKNLPVGDTLRYCSIAGVPAGWTVIQTNLPGSCIASGSTDSVMQHTSCVAGDTNCYPSSTSISASPQTFTVPYGNSAGSTTINWNSTSNNSPCVWIKNTGGQPKLWSCLGSGAHSAVWPYVPAGGTTTLWLSGGGSTSPSPNLAQVIVSGLQASAPVISASPTVVQIPNGSSRGSSTISYNLTGSGHNAMCVWQQTTGGSGPSVWSCMGGTTWSGVWPYVPLGGNTTFWLSPSQTSPTPRLAEIVVTGQ